MIANIHETAQRFYSLPGFIPKDHTKQLKLLLFFLVSFLRIFPRPSPQPSFHTTAATCRNSFNAKVLERRRRNVHLNAAVTEVWHNILEAKPSSMMFCSSKTLPLGLSATSPRYTLSDIVDFILTNTRAMGKLLMNTNLLSVLSTCTNDSYMFLSMNKATFS